MQAGSNRSKERERQSITKKKRKKEQAHRTEYVHFINARAKL
jgi:hypothetical protein